MSMNSMAPNAGPQPAQQALYLAGADVPLAAWLHRPAGPVRQAVLLCSPFGREEISAHRAWRCLAEALAAQGHCVLRFDYAGCGDSGGDESLPDLAGAWLRSVHAAADALCRLSGQARLVIAGLRLGGLLALEAAVARADVSAVVAIAPVLSGRAYLRELRALQAAMQGGAVGADEVFDGLEAGGFVLPAEALLALEGLDWRQPARAPAPRVLALDRAELPTLARWVNALQGLGVQVRHETLAGYDGLMLDPHHVVLPQAMWQAVIDEIGGLPATADGGALAGAAPAIVNCARLHEVEERAVGLPACGLRLQAVHSRPLQLPPSGRLVLMLNAGATRRIGPSRSYVTLARRLAAQGHEALRVDLSGLGDSPAQPGTADNVVYTPTAVAEVRDLVDEVSRWPGVRSVQLLGLCAGAYHGFKAAARGAPVSAVLAINPLTFFWHDDLPLDMPLRPHQVIGEMDRYREGLFSAARWHKLLRGEVNLRHLGTVLLKWMTAHLSRSLRAAARLVRWPLKEDLARELRDITASGIRLDFIFAEDEPGQALLHDQGGAIVARLRSQGRLALHDVSGADHVFTRWAPRQQFLHLVVGLMGANDAAAPVNEGQQGA